MPVRLQADGANLRTTWGGKRVLLTIAPLAMKDKPGINSEFVICCYYGKENQTDYERYFQPCFNELNELCSNGFEMHGKKYKLELVLSADWIALALVRFCIRLFLLVVSFVRIF